MHKAQFQSVRSLSCGRPFATPGTAARQASPSITNSRSLLRFMSLESVMPSNHLILCRPLLRPPPIFPGIRVFSKKSGLRIRWAKNWRFSYIRHSLQYPKRGSMSVGSDHPQTTGLRICGTYTEQNITQP